MKLSEMAKIADLETAVLNIDHDVTSAYSADLLSDVVGNVDENSILITVQVHKNIVAVASLVGLAGIIITHDRRPEQELLDIAKEQEVNIFLTKESSFTIAGKLYQAGIISS